MNNTDDSRGGTYLHTSLGSHKVLKSIVFGLVVLVVVTMLYFETGSEKSQKVYLLPEEIPNVSLPSEFSGYSGNKSLEKIVVPYFNFSMKAGQDIIEINLPIIQAEFGVDFNLEVSERLDSLIQNMLFYIERDESYIIKGMSYEAHLDRNVLSILLWTHYADGQSKCEPWLFDLAEGGTSHDTWEWTEKLLDLNYSSFLWITDYHIQNAFSTKYQEAVNSVIKSEVSEKEQAFMDSYNCILQGIQHDVSNALNRWIYPADGKIYLVYELPLITDDWYSGLRTETQVDELDSTILQYQQMVTPEETIRDVISNMSIHVMGGADQGHAILIRSVFYSSPEIFIKVISDMDDQCFAIDSLLLYLDDTEQIKIRDICNEVRVNHLSEKDIVDVIDIIISKIEGLGTID